MRTFLLFCLLSLAFSATAQQKKVLIIGIDGCRQDALQLANTPHLDGLLDHSIYSYDALTHGPTWSATGWSSMLTGVWETKHGAYSNAFENTNFEQYPHFFNHVEAHNSELSTVSICHWAPINTEILDAADIELNVDTDAEVSSQAVGFLSGFDPDIMFLHYDDVDHTGHGFGFFPDVPEYMETIETTDSLVGEVLTALENRPTYAEEDWLIIVSTDHGGNTSHGGASFEERNIFIIVAREGMEPMEISKTASETNIMTALQLVEDGLFLKPDDSTPFSFGEAQDFSIEMRVNAPSLVGDPSFISNKDWNSGLNPGWIFSTPVNNSGAWKVNIGDGIDRADINGNAINDGLWHHLTVTFDRDGMMTAYQNGEYVGEASIAEIGNIDTPYDLVVGQDGTENYANSFLGGLSEIRIFNTVLSAQTVRDYTCANMDEMHPNYDNLLAYYPLNDGSGTIIANTIDATNPLLLNSSEANWDTEPSTLSCANFDNTPRMPDIAVTALTHLCIPIDPSWDLDGHSLIDNCEPDAVDTPIKSTFSLAPNPANEELNITFENAKPRIIRILDLNGKILQVTQSRSIKEILLIENYPTGTYFVEVNDGQKTERKKVVIL